MAAWPSALANINEALVGTADKQVTLRVNSNRRTMVHVTSLSLPDGG